MPPHELPQRIAILHGTGQGRDGPARPEGVPLKNVQIVLTIWGGEPVTGVAGAPQRPSGRGLARRGEWSVMTAGPDRWHRWLLDVRFGGDAAGREKDLTEFLYPVRDAVLDKAQLRRGDTLLDVGTGDGLIAFGALDRLGPSGRVIFSDISQDLLDHCRKAAGAEGLLGRCRFVRASADCLTGVADVSADVLTTRSVLIYVKDKAAALREFYRVLKPGGRVSLFEPINVLMSGCGPDLFFGYDVTPVRDLAAKRVHPAARR